MHTYEFVPDDNKCAVYELNLEIKFFSSARYKVGKCLARVVS